MYEDLDVIAMKVFDDTTDVFIIKTNTTHDVIELLQLYPDKYIDGFYLKEKSPKLCEEIINRCIDFDRSLQGICYHPKFPENFEKIKKDSIYDFDVPEWCYAVIHNISIE